MLPSLISIWMKALTRVRGWISIYWNKCVILIINNLSYISFYISIDFNVRKRAIFHRTCLFKYGFQMYERLQTRQKASVFLLKIKTCYFAAGWVTHYSIWQHVTWWIYGLLSAPFGRGFHYIYFTASNIWTDFVIYLYKRLLLLTVWFESEPHTMISPDRVAVKPDYFILTTW